MTTKERSVKSEIERVLSDWEDKCTDLEDQVSLAKRAQAQAENACKEATTDLKAIKKECKTLKQTLRARDEELVQLSQRYEAEIEKQHHLRDEDRGRLKQMESKLNFEIDFYKKQLEDLMRQKEFQKTATQIP